MNPRLEGYAAAVLEVADGEAASRLAADLAAIDRLFAGNEALRAAMSDTAVAGASRRAVLDELLEGKVADGARRAAAFAAGAVPATEVPGAMTWLAHRARRAAEG
ncbi:MAG: F0F1 ATP synthase subunit delta, partial [Acidimicrobiales bacterium]